MLRRRPLYALGTTFALNAAFWAISLSTTPGPWPARHVAAEFFSTSAVLIMSTNLLLVTRAKPFEDFYGGLDKVFISHRLNGLTAVTLLSTHFLLMPESAGWVTSKLIGYPTLAALLIAVLVAIAPRSPWRRLVPLRYQDWKLAHRTQGLLVAAGVTHSLTAHPYVLALPIMRVWVYGVAAIGLAAYVFRETAEPGILQRHRYRVGTPVHVADDVLEIPLEPVEHGITHVPGQFAFVRFDSGPTHEQHPFTISTGLPGERLRFSVKASGDYTRALQQHLTAGSSARIEGPYGRFDFRTGGRRQLWLAGGIGVTPFLAFLPAVEEDRDVRFVWTVHARDDAIYLDEVGETLARRPRVDFTLHTTETDGRLSLADLHLERPQALDVFICGPVPMRDAFIAQLLPLGVPLSRIHYEEFSLR
jgi:predicted ferric reductase